MDADETSFQPAWWGTGLGKLRPCQGTYGRFDHASLPAIPEVKLDGSFHWLRAEPTQSSSILEENRAELRPASKAVTGFAAAKKIALPNSFQSFFAESLGDRIRSCTDCGLDLAEEMIRSPRGTGNLLRFLADSQGCAFWYLFLADGGGHCVLASPDYFGADAEDEESPADPESLVFAAPDFESFIFRFWLENEIWFNIHNYGPPSPAAAGYMSAYGWTPVMSAKTSPSTAKKNWWSRIFGK